MKIRDAKDLYRTSIKDLREKRNEYLKKKEILEKQARVDPYNGSDYEKDTATINMTIDALDKEYEKAQGVLEQIINQEVSIANAEVSKQQADAMEKTAVDEAKVFETARRIAQGGKVPAKDERKVMDYSMELYMASKNAAMLVKLQKNKKSKKYDSLWDDDEENPEYPDPMETAGNSEFSGATPEIASADSIVESM